jgi:DNA-binding HxlR family transcriptional regulator
MDGMKSHTPVGDQLIGSAVNALNQARIDDEIFTLSRQDIAYELACKEMLKPRDFVASPGNILGSMSTKHGEIAEQVEVAVRNSEQAIEERLQDASTFRATFEGVGRTAPQDYLIDGMDVQSKFINGTNNNLVHVLKHMEAYPNFGKDGSFYHIPKDTWQEIQDVLDGKHVEGLKSTTIEAIKAKVAEIERQTQRPFADVVRPGVSDYKDVQLGKIDETLDKHDQELAKQNDAKRAEIIDDHQPSLAEGMRATAMGAAVGGAFALGTGIYRKYRDGKNIFRGDFDAQDWQDVGLDSLKGAAVGGISAGAIYTLTNYASMGAPFASALVTATKGVASLAHSYQRGEIGLDEFTDLGLIVCAESAIVGAMTVAGQALIPVPVLGALIGSISGKFMVTVAKSLDGKARQVLQARMDEFARRLDAIEQQVLNRILSEFAALGELTKAAFNVETNRQLLEASITLAQAHGVEDDKIIKNADDLDAFMTA